MNTPQVIISCIVIASIGLFLWGKWRHDIVALAALLASVVMGVVPEAEAFSGFGHPAVITVACILILSNGLQQTGAMEIFARRLMPTNAGPTASIAALAGIGALLSAFMNNIGALALLMPASLMIATRLQIAPGRVLMPLSFGSILGGMTTLIGTPPNLIVSGFRGEAGMGTFGMFDFAPVGGAVAIAGVAFVAIFSRWLVPTRRGPAEKSFETEHYLTEGRVKEGGRATGMTIREASERLTEVNVRLVGLVRDEKRIAAQLGALIRPNDILILKAEPDNLTMALSTLDLHLEEDVKPEHLASDEDSDQGELTILEMAVLPDSRLAGRSATEIRLRSRYGVDLLAVSRRGERAMPRLRSMKIAAGDVLMVQGGAEQLALFASDFRCLPLADRGVRIPDKSKAIAAIAIMAAAIAGASFGLLPAALAFAAGALAAMITRVVAPRNVYQSVDWPVIVLLGALMPVAGAIASTGLAEVIAGALIKPLAGDSPVIALILVLVVTMSISDFMNNAATAAMMCPLAISVAQQMNVAPDPFLMAVAIGASCAFLTPIGHQNNTLILGPGAFRFGDYWRLGLPLEILTVLIAIPLLMFFWPF